MRLSRLSTTVCSWKLMLVFFESSLSRSCMFIVTLISFYFVATSFCWTHSIFTSSSLLICSWWAFQLRSSTISSCWILIRKRHSFKSCSSYSILRLSVISWLRKATFKLCNLLILSSKSRRKRSSSSCLSWIVNIFRSSSILFATSWSLSSAASSYRRRNSVSSA